MVVDVEVLAVVLLVPVLDVVDVVVDVVASSAAFVVVSGAAVVVAVAGSAKTFFLHVHPLNEFAQRGVTEWISHPFGPYSYPMQASLFLQITSHASFVATSTSLS